MPIYEYKCLDCDTHVEKMQKISDAPLEICEKCGGRLEKQVSLSGFQFKGGGWYVTDYAKKSGVAPSAEKSEKSEKTEKTEKSENAEKTSAAESTAKSETASNTTSETKSAAKTETAAKKE